MLLIILAGMPCSGKTELANLLAKKLEINHGLPTVVVDPDKIRGMIPALKERFDPEREPFVEHLAQVLIEKSLEKKNIVISDDMNYYESARHRLVQVASKHKVKYVIVYLTVSVEIAKARNSARASRIPEELISKIAQSFDPPGAKYKWDRPSIIIDTEKTSSEDAANRVLRLVLSTVKGQATESKRPHSYARSSHSQETTDISQLKCALDESTRAILNELFSSGKLDVELSKSASKLRKTFINKVLGTSMTIEDAEAEFRKRVAELSLKDHD